MSDFYKPLRPKRCWRPGTMLYPLPAVLVSCGSTPSTRNLITVAWTGTVCSDPAMCYISVRPIRHSHKILMEEMEFTIILTNEDMCRATDWCGVRSGADYDKWKETGLTPVKGVKVGCYYADEAPVAIECRVKEVIRLGSHDMFLGEVLNVIVDERYIDPATDALCLDQAGLMVYSHGHYYALGRELGHFGFSVRKKPLKKQ